jgi:hypothetical protein
LDIKIGDKYKFNYVDSGFFEVLFKGGGKIYGKFFYDNGGIDDGFLYIWNITEFNMTKITNLPPKRDKRCVWW